MKKFLAAVCVLMASYQSVTAQEYTAKPSKEHGVLKAEVGVWDARISIDIPGGETMTSTGVETVEMLGELWTVSNFEYDFMGNKSVGHGVIGFDPDKKKYVGTWHESGNPYPSFMEGTYDAASKKMTFVMKSKDVEGNEQDYTIVTTYVDEKTKTFEMNMKMPGSDDYTKIMLIVFTKRDK